MLPIVDEFREDLHNSEADKQRILDGKIKIVDWSPGEGLERELAVGMGCLAKTKPEKLAQMYGESAVTKEISVITARGQITGGKSPCRS